jgi:hypothetical protein
MTAYTAAHVTHEACEKIGGIGTVLEGIITSPVYQRNVRRTILIGPTANHMESDPARRLGTDGTVRYSTVDNLDDADLGGKLRPIEWAFNVAFVYGTRDFVLPGSEDHTGTADVLLIDVFRANQHHTNQFKRRLFETFGIDSMRYEHDWGFEEYVRLAEPAFYALLALLNRNELPCLLFSHEFMGLPTAFKAVMDGYKQFRTVFHAHECGTARRLVEHHPGHDTAFYNILKLSRQRRLYVDQVFGDQSEWFRHALVSRAHVCDAIVAVGPHVAEELHFLGPHFDHHVIDLVYNGVPPLKVSFDTVKHSRKLVADYAERLLDWRPNVLMTHVTRPVISKGIWRDVQVCHELDERFGREGRSGVVFIVTTAGGTRRPQDVAHMEAEYGWPRHHREGYPDLVGPEVGFNQMIDAFNAVNRNIQLVLVNQFGWSGPLLGHRAPKGMNFGDLRRAADIEFGMATYEPFGISPLEPLGAGTICVISSVCGCRGFVDEVTAGAPVKNVLVADYTRLDRDWPLAELLQMTQHDRDVIERRVARELADQLVQRLARTDRERIALLESGQKLVIQMGWDQVLAAKPLPMLQRVFAPERSNAKERIASIAKRGTTGVTL